MFGFKWTSIIPFLRQQASDTLHICTDCCLTTTPSLHSCQREHLAIQLLQLLQQTDQENPPEKT